MRRLALTFAVSCALGVVAPVAAMAADAPPAPPPGCQVVLGTPAAFTGSAQGFANKAETFFRLCT